MVVYGSEFPLEVGKVYDKDTGHLNNPDAVTDKEGVSHTNFRLLVMREATKDEYVAQLIREATHTPAQAEEMIFWYRINYFYLVSMD